MADLEEGLAFLSAVIMAAKQEHSHDAQGLPSIPRAASFLQERDYWPRVMPYYYFLTSEFIQKRESWKLSLVSITVSSNTK